MKRNKLTLFILVLVIAALSFGSALAAPLAQEPAPPGPCPAGTVSGTVVAVDAETGMVTVDTGTIVCTVDVNIDESHPVALLLGRYFGDINPETMTAALKEVVDTVTGCANDLDANGTWTWVAPNEDGTCPTDSIAVTVTADNLDGYFTAQPVAGGDPIILEFIDPAYAGSVKGALETLAVDWALESEGNFAQVSDEIAQYHEDGMGFGVLVKLYAIAEQEALNCAQPAEDETTTCTPATVEDLVVLFQTSGMGQIFKDFGKPDKVGVGHVRQALDDKVTGQDKVKDKVKDQNNSGDDIVSDAAVKKNNKPPKEDNSLKGVCNAVAKNGKPKKNATCP